MSLNTQSIRAIFDQLDMLLSELYDKELASSVICLQKVSLETKMILPHIFSQGAI